MSRYTQLTKSKREFLQSLIEIDTTKNFLTAVEYSEIFTAIDEGRYLTEESIWWNTLAQKHKNIYLKWKRENKV